MVYARSKAQNALGAIPVPIRQCSVPYKLVVSAYTSEVPINFFVKPIGPLVLQSIAILSS